MYQVKWLTYVCYYSEKLYEINLLVFKNYSLKWTEIYSNCLSQCLI